MAATLNNKSNHGGKRDGAGRKKKAPTKTLSYRVPLHYTLFDGVSYKNKWAIIDPIPITAELLEKNKFVFDVATGTYWLNMSTHYLELMPAGGYWWPTYASVPEVSSESEQRVSTCRIHSVHQLQNLYHALTGEELEVNLSAVKAQGTI